MGEDVKSQISTPQASATSGSDSPDILKTTELGRLKKRAEFVRVGQGRRAHGRGFTLQAAAVTRSADAQRALPTPVPPRIGYTVTKKTGNSVVRNRIRRRLKEAVRLHAGAAAQTNYDYVILGRPEALTEPFAVLCSNLIKTFTKLHAPKPNGAPHHRSAAKGQRSQTQIETPLSPAGPTLATPDRDQAKI